MIRTDEQIEESVQNGIKLLDLKKPDWVKGIDLNNLSTFSPMACVLGQAYGTFVKGLEAVFDSHDRVQCATISARHGFLIYEEESKFAYKLLDEHWGKHIRALQQPA